MKIKLLITGALLIFISGCSTVKPSITFYQLSPPPQAQSVDLSLASLLVEPVELIDYLKRSNILLQRQSGQLYVTKYQVWAEPLDQAIGRAMVNYLNQSQHSFRAQSQLLIPCRQDCFRVKLLVEQFYPTEQGVVVFSGKYQLFQDNNLIAQQDFNLQQAQTTDGYAMSVKSLHQLTVKLASQIQRQVLQRL
jgi:uncharacterized lipoprotein YmbA